MLWFKHKSDARNSLKLRKVRRKYGADGYAIYWFCLEAIAYEVDKDNLTFDLREDAETIGFELSVQEKRVEEIMRYMIEIGLFETSGSVITCLKLAESIDKSMTNSPKMRQWLGKQKLLNESGDVMTCTDTVKTCAELEVEVEKEVEKNKHSGQQVDLEDVIKNDKKKIPVCQHEKIIEIYHEVLPELPKTILHLWGGARKKNLNARWKEHPQHQDLEFWRFYFGLIRQSSFHMGDNDRGWQADLEWLVKQTNFAKILGKYA